MTWVFVFLFLWVLTGIPAYWYWPLKYKHNMDCGDWISVSKNQFWMIVIFGPFNIILNFPL